MCPSVSQIHKQIFYECGCPCVKDGTTTRRTLQACIMTFNKLTCQDEWPEFTEVSSRQLVRKNGFNFMQKKYTEKFPNLADENLWAKRGLFSPEY